MFENIWEWFLFYFPFQIFENWLQIAENPVDPLSNPQTWLRSKFTLNGFSSIYMCIFNETFNNEKSFIQKLSIKNMWSKYSINAEIKNARDRKFSRYSYDDSCRYFKFVLPFIYYILLSFKWTILQTLNRIYSKMMQMKYNDLPYTYYEIYL